VHELEPKLIMTIIARSTTRQENKNMCQTDNE